MRIAEDYILREIAGELMIIPTKEAALKFQGLMIVNETGALLWKKLQDGDCSKEELLQELCGKYQVDIESAGQDIQEFLDKLKNEGLLLEKEEI